MPDGQLFTSRGVIQPGWELVVPPPSVATEQIDGEQWYTVESGDTLSGIAARLLRDEARWQELFEANRGARSPDGAHTLANANLIWPGLRLRLPLVSAEPSETGIKISLPAITGAVFATE